MSLIRYPKTPRWAIPKCCVTECCNNWFLYNLCFICLHKLSISWRRIIATLPQREERALTSQLEREKPALPHTAASSSAPSCLRSEGKLVMPLQFGYTPLVPEHNEHSPLSWSPQAFLIPPTHSLYSELVHESTFLDRQKRLGNLRWPAVLPGGSGNMQGSAPLCGGCMRYEAWLKGSNSNIDITRYLDITVLLRYFCSFIPWGLQCWSEQYLNALQCLCWSKEVKQLPEPQPAFTSPSLHDSPRAASTHWYGTYSYFSNPFSIMKQQKHNVTQSLKRRLIFTGKKIKTNLWRRVKVNSETVQNFELTDLIIQIILVSQERNSPLSGSHPLHRTSILHSCIWRYKINSGVFSPKCRQVWPLLEESCAAVLMHSLVAGLGVLFPTSKHRAKAVLHWPKFLSEIHVPPCFL